jgi:paraquat-inducible protein A
LQADQVAFCSRCHAALVRPASERAAARTAAAATAALVLYWPAVLLPILEIEQLGHRYESSLLRGTFDLLSHGSWFVGTVVLLFSIVFPLLKIVLLLELSLLGMLPRRHKSFTYRAMELVGKWSMLDVMLLAFMVMLVKLGDLVQFYFGPAVIAFVVCVAMSMIASFLFDPHLIWQEPDERTLETQR